MGHWRACGHSTGVRLEPLRPKLRAQAIATTLVLALGDGMWGGILLCLSLRPLVCPSC